MFRNRLESSQMSVKIIHWVCRVNSSSAQRIFAFHKTDCIPLLLDAQVDPNAIEDFWYTPLLLLASNRSIDIDCINILLDAGAHIYQINNNCVSALNILNSRLNENYILIISLLLISSFPSNAAAPMLFAKTE